MYLDEIREYCMAKPGTTEGLPFGPTTLVFKVMGKMFALLSLDEPETRVNLKCDPERAVQLREEYDAVIPGWHMNKTHWNTVYTERSLTSSMVRELIDHSYELVSASLSKKLREELAGLK